MHPHLILVVDDDPALRDVLAQLLAGEGYWALAVADGAEAIGRVDAMAPDLILSDVVMPGMGGIELAERLRAQGDGTPVILISAAEVAVDLPGVRFVRKPFDIDHVVDHVAALIAESFPDPVARVAATAAG